LLNTIIIDDLNITSLDLSKCIRLKFLTIEDCPRLKKIIGLANDVKLTITKNMKELLIN
jgi:hypothetical protein